MWFVFYSEKAIGCVQVCVSNGKMKENKSSSFVVSLKVGFRFAKAPTENKDGSKLETI